MAVRGEESASSIDSHVRETLEKMVGEIRSSVEDVRHAVDSQLKAALQSVQADVNAISFLPFIQKTITELQQSIEEEALLQAQIYDSDDYREFKAARAEGREPSYRSR